MEETTEPTGYEYEYEPTSTDPERLVCEVCGVDIVYSGRGRKPKRCDEHKRNQAGTTGTRKSTGQVASIRSGMTDLYRAAGSGLVILGGMTGDQALKNDGELIDNRADVLAAEWAKLAENDPKVRKALSNLSTGSAWGGVVLTHTLLAFAMIKNHQQYGKPKAPKQPKPPKVRQQVVQQPQAQSEPSNGTRPVFVPDNGVYPSES